MLYVYIYTYSVLHTTYSLPAGVHPPGAEHPSPEGREPGVSRLVAPMQAMDGGTEPKKKKKAAASLETKKMNRYTNTYIALRCIASHWVALHCIVLPLVGVPTTSFSFVIFSTTRLC